MTRGYRYIYIYCSKVCQLTENRHSERVMEFVETDLEDGKKGTEYICWETYGGLLGPAVKGFVGTKLIDRFGDYTKDVKEFCEGASKA